MEQLTELAQIADEQGALHVVSEHLQPVHGMDALRPPRRVVADLALDDLVGEVTSSHIGEDQAVLELPDRLGAQAKGHHEHGSDRVELDQVEAPERRSVLVLFAALDAHLEPLDPVGQVRDLVLVDGQAEEIHEPGDKRDGDR